MKYFLSKRNRHRPKSRCGVIRTVASLNRQSTKSGVLAAEGENDDRQGLSEPCFDHHDNRNVGACLDGGAPAQSRYSSGGWQDPSAKNSVLHTERARGYQAPPERHDEVRMRKFLKELRSLIRDARQARAADPRFLGDLRQLVQRYDRWRLRRVLYDNFSDGNLSYNPTWRASGSGIRVSSYNGLRMHYEPHRNVQSNRDNRRDSRDALIG